MKAVRRVFWGQYLLAVLVMAVGYAMTGSFLAAGGIAALGSLWGLARWRKAAGLETAFFSMVILGGAAGFFQGVAGWALLLSVVAALGAWDLDSFLQRLEAAERVEYSSGLGRDHLRRLAMVQGIGLLVGLLTLGIRARIPFWWELLLILMAVVSLSVLIFFMRRQAAGE